MTRKTVVVLGGGVGGLTVANDLRRRLDRKHDILVVDKTGVHMFSPSLLWLQVGLREPKVITKDLKRLLKNGIDVVCGQVSSIDPAAKSVTVDGKTIAADYLVVALGAQLAPEKVPGLEQAGHDLYSLEGSIAVRDYCRGIGSQYQETRIAVLVAGMPFKCPAAPYEAAMLLSHFARSRFPENRVSISLYSPESAPMRVAGQEASMGVEGMLAKCGVEYHPNHQVRSVDPDSRTMIFEDGVTASCDFLAYVPPHVVPEVLSESGLATEGGWIEVDRGSMETEFPDVFAIGDNASIPLEMGLPLPKAGVFAHGQAQAVARTIATRISGKGSEGVFDGYGACFVEVGGGRAGFGSGNFYGLPLPGIKFREPSRMWHLAKVLFEKRWMKQWL